MSSPSDVTILAPPSSNLRPISALLSSEHHHMPPTFPDHLLSRNSAVHWILNVVEFYKFSPLTAYLAVSYLDRFLSSNTLLLQGQNGDCNKWAMQLLSVACVSVAAKMEETEVPILSDLQILDPKFVFEPKSVTRMELLLMTSLNWRMRSVTPFDYVSHFADLIGPPFNVGHVIVPNAADLFVATCRVVEFSKFRPSEIAASAIICGFKGIADLSGGDVTDLLQRLSEWVNEEKVRACVQLMEASLIDTCQKCFGAKPESPVGVIEAASCTSCDSCQKLGVIVTPDSGDEPPAKRLRFDDFQCTEERN